MHSGRNYQRPLAQLKPDGSLDATFHYGDKPNVPEALERGGKLYRILTDHLGSVRVVVDTQTGQIVQEMEYDAWGRVTQDTNPGFQPFGYAGGLYDADTGLTRFGARDYDGETGRWTAKDPILFGGGSVGLYDYVGGNPVSFVDPLGLRNYSEAETRAILDQERADAEAPPLVALFNMLNNHRGRGKMDFGPKSSPTDTFDVGCGKRLRPYEFGNYVAGYGGVYFGGPTGYVGVRAGGLLFNAVASVFRRQEFDWDMSSVPSIDAGASRAYSEIAGRSDSNGYSDCTCGR